MLERENDFHFQEFNEVSLQAIIDYIDYCHGLGFNPIIPDGAFTRGVREEINRRDGGKCVICGATDHLEAAHIDHSKNNPLYNDPSNGRMMCTDDHLQDHINRAGRNGLPLHQNDWAIEQLQKRANRK